MKEPVLVIMAAGMGSRYGGLKQMDPVDKEGHAIIDFSMYDAKQAGFKKVVFIIKHAIEKDFKEVVGKHVEGSLDVEYVFQELDKIPEGFSIPEGRVKPWGTAHALSCLKGVVDGPFAVINSDDYYGAQAFRDMYEWLSTHQDDEVYRYCMMGYEIQNTITENGHVSRGVCETDKDGHLKEICERTRIEKKETGAAYTEDDGQSWTDLPDGTPVSMNFWGFQESLIDEMYDGFAAFLSENLPKNPLKCEYFIPTVVEKLLKEEKATVKVLKSPDKWYGVTYKEDKATVVEAIARFKEEGKYPQYLWKKENKMKIGFGCDHAAIDLKETLMKHLTEKGYECVDYGASERGVKVDYPIPGRKVAEAIVAGEVEKGVLICGTGIGISLAANKVPGIRAAVCSEPYSARLTVQHNDANIIAMGARVVGDELAKMIVDEFFGAEYEGGRHARRVQMIKDIEAHYNK